ncbi:hypothetical protein PCANC_02501 [Puccinia coronata f. sp. avenae]|uniref:Uncharacterized protein n=1 Tax=Puccinia coronata f. sp. avenae TaxID=200324 RepID=A0A2N5VYJ6_9BASI|nr:hypothetical protein PCASD_10527 [Puccinia coronata f. sp. avenae]PLW55056.1 hypothetical protein PCANC_02501 [Puccinia coronata f. sp. avenae]
MDQSPPAPSQSPKPDQEAAVPSQCQRFLDLHPQLADAKERFQSFYSTVGLKAVQEYLDSLLKIPSSLPTEISPEFIKWWCRLLNRQLQFDSVIIALEIKPNDPLRKELSQLAFDEAADLEPGTSEPNIPWNPEFISVRTRFLGIHSYLTKPEQSFQKLSRYIKLEGLQDYLSRLKNLERLAQHHKQKGLIIPIQTPKI